MNHGQHSADSPGASGTGFDVTEHVLAALVRENSRAPLERWLLDPLAALEELERAGGLEVEVALDLRAGFQAALELFAQLELEARAATTPPAAR